MKVFIIPRRKRITRIDQIKKAEQGDAEAQYYLGVMYDNGYGVKQGYKKAKKQLTGIKSQQNKGILAPKQHWQKFLKASSSTVFVISVIYTNGQNNQASIKGSSKDNGNNKSKTAEVKAYVFWRLVKNYDM
ncbi:hypothetical protein AGMMS50222_03160 [Endomicrobiia bacterium]|nr:hypothetical protein AGMMS49531_06040 [Endomicrobiia bacterium]GHT64960.1 hypothetical protein AGMMS49556_03950 [Endomicrobiia bacterium]GHT69507.1 hypothetical protein AGMMS49950_02370 [Endomicrobiia bacterium]GHT74252.1 hypothetical protein AGMMS50222_03070 [Endomicrobiia bacterium]GHT74277.1 hypothetical protein AGMMS50222_03160 [Endomicrobiia bacterium]